MVYWVDFVNFHILTGLDCNIYARSKRLERSYLCVAIERKLLFVMFIADVKPFRGGFVNLMTRRSFQRQRYSLIYGALTAHSDGY